ncbi:hypothetical protein [Paracoccus jeotgali]|uniref:hypothetical protein n=1 Tax=Paracoccus jeotgali TaxID=2065379 RepID=UPI0028AD84A7|nr:hypothetical protein [Paracoccus jeotgali]
MRAADAYTGDAEVDELLFAWGRVIGNAEGWTRGFALGVQRDRKRPGWTPSPRQLSIMRRLVAELPAVIGEDNCEVIEH